MTISALPRFLGGRNVGTLGQAGWFPSCQPSRCDFSGTARSASEGRVPWERWRWPLAGALTPSPLASLSVALPRGGSLSRARRKSRVAPFPLCPAGPSGRLHPAWEDHEGGHTPRQGHGHRLGGCLPPARTHGGAEHLNHPEFLRAAPAALWHSRSRSPQIDSFPGRTPAALRLGNISPPEATFLKLPHTVSPTGRKAGTLRKSGPHAPATACARMAGRRAPPG